MGEDNGNCPYELGVTCSFCHISLFNSRTPLYILASFSGIAVCPGGSGLDHNGSYLLTQNPILSCQWNFVDALVRVSLDFSLGSDLSIVEQRGLPNIFFADLGGIRCDENYINGIPACGGFFSGLGGTAIISWGCSIHA